MAEKSNKFSGGGAQFSSQFLTKKQVQEILNLTQERYVDTLIASGLIKCAIINKKKLFLPEDVNALQQFLKGKELSINYKEAKIIDQNSGVEVKP